MMPFGIKAANKVFQKNEEAFASISGIYTVADDIIIAAMNIKEHDQILRQVFERAKEKNVKFNFDKLQVSVHGVRYLGMLETSVGHSLLININKCCSWRSMAIAICRWALLF